MADTFEPVITSLKRHRARVVVVFFDRMVNASLEPILAEVKDFNVSLLPIQLRESRVQLFLGSPATDSVQSYLTTRQLAVAAYQLVQGSSNADEPDGIGLAISKLHQGRGHLVLHSRHATHQCTFQLPSDLSQPSCIGNVRGLLVRVLATELGLAKAGDDDIDQQPSTEWLHERAQPHWQELVGGKRLASGDVTECPVLFPGSFHPIHEGHRQMSTLAASRLGQPVHLEISVTNADKPALDFLTIGQRVRQAESIGPVVLTQAPKFVDKARLFPGATFLIGADTALRLDDVRFYDGCENKRDAAIEVIAGHRCRFLVFGRLMEQSFQDASKMSVTRQLRKLCDFVPSTEFRVDISSRELRRQGEPLA